MNRNALELTQNGALEWGDETKDSRAVLPNTTKVGIISVFLF